MISTGLFLRCCLTVFPFCTNSLYTQTPAQLQSHSCLPPVCCRRGSPLSRRAGRGSCPFRHRRINHSCMSCHASKYAHIEAKPVTTLPFYTLILCISRSMGSPDLPRQMIMQNCRHALFGTHVQHPVQATAYRSRHHNTGSLPEAELHQAVSVVEPVRRAHHDRYHSPAVTLSRSRQRPARILRISDLDAAPPSNSVIVLFLL